MSQRHKRLKDTGNKGLEFKEDKRRRMCRNNVGNRLSSLEFNSNSLGTEKMQVDVLAQILVDIFLERKRNANKSREAN